MSQGDHEGSAESIQKRRAEKLQQRGGLCRESFTGLYNCLQGILAGKATLAPQWGQAVQGSSTRCQELANVRYCPLMISGLQPEWTGYRQSTSLAAKWQSQRKVLTSDKIHTVVPSLWSWMLPGCLYSAVTRRYMRVYCRMLPPIIHMSLMTASLTVVIAFHRMKSLY